MMMKKSSFLRALAITGAVALSSNVFATTVWLKCQHCDSSNAQQFAEQSRLEGSVMIYSLANRFHARFESQWEVIGQGCHTNGNEGLGKSGANPSLQSHTQTAGHCQNVLIATPIAPDPEQNEFMSILQQLSDNTAGTMKVLIELDGYDVGEPGRTAHDFPNNHEFERRVVNEVSRILYTPSGAINYVVRGLEGPLFVNMLNIIRAGGQISLGGDFNTVTVVITMSDGSKITLFYNGDWQLTSTMARSAEGRVIMTEDNIRGFTEDPLPMVNDQSMEAFLNNARRFGIRVNSSTGWSGGSRAVVCTSYTDENGEEQTVCAGSGG